MNDDVLKIDCTDRLIITAGSTYLDIDAYACIVAMAELLCLKGMDAIAYSTACYNYSVCGFLVNECDILNSLPNEYRTDNVKYVIVDVSDPNYIADRVPLDKVSSVYDHHVGFEEYWSERIGNSAHIEFIGAAATLIFREWKNAGLLSKMKSATARLLVAAILDNTLNLTSSNTTNEDVVAKNMLCEIAKIDEKWCQTYFETVGNSIVKDLKNAIFGDVKSLNKDLGLPERFSQICIWDAECVLNRLPEIRQWFSDSDFLINIIDISRNCSYFVTDNDDAKIALTRIFEVSFSEGIAKTAKPYLRKQILKAILNLK